jgi:hypothetical protein
MEHPRADQAIIEGDLNADQLPAAKKALEDHRTEIVPLFS